MSRANTYSTSRVLPCSAGCNVVCSLSGPGSRSEAANDKDALVVYELGSLRGGAGASLADLRSRHRKAPVSTLAREAGTASRTPVASQLKVVQVLGDGRCMFRALAKGFAQNAGFHISGESETASADELREAVSDALCRSPERRDHFSEALPGVNTEGGLPKYCQRLQSPKFWGGEVELFVLSKMVSTPIYVYRSAQDAGLSSKQRQGFVTMVSYGEDFETQGRKPVRLLYRGGNHYDLLTE